MAPKRNKPVPGVVCINELPHAFIKYLDESGATDVLPLVNIPELKPPKYEFDKNSVYDAFWSPSVDGKSETYEEARKRSAKIPRHSAGSGNMGAGMYPCTVLLTGRNLLDLEFKMKESRVREPSEKRLQTIQNTKSNFKQPKISHSDSSQKTFKGPPSVTSSSSGFSSETSSTNANKSHKSAGPSSKGNKESSIKVPIHKSKTKEQIDSFLKSCDSDSNDDSDDDAVIPVKCMKEELQPLKEKVKKYKRTIAKLEDEVSSLKASLRESQRRVTKLTDLNINYQEHMAKCSQVSVTPGIKWSEESMAGGTENHIPGNVTLSMVPADKERGKYVEKKSVLSTPKAACSSISALREANEISVSVAVPDNDRSDDPFTSEQETNNETEGVDRVESSSVSNKTSERGREIERPDESEAVCIYENIYVDKEIYKVMETLLKNEHLTHGSAEKEDRRFVLDLTQLLFTEEDLATHTVTGEVSNIQKKQLGENAVKYPKLCPKKVAAIERALLRRVLRLSEKLTKEEKEATKILDRASDVLARKWIGSAAQNAKKRFKRNQKPKQ